MSAATIPLKPGDIAACYGRDPVSRCIRWMTASPLAPAGLRLGPSHVAVITRHQGELLWLESTTLSGRPCRIQQRPITGVQAHTPAERINDCLAAGGAVALYRLVEIESLSKLEATLLSRILIDHFLLGSTHYDLSGALLSGTRVFQWTRLFPRADLQQLFCSELVAAVLMRLGRLPRGNPTRYNPARLLRTLVRHGTVRREYFWEGRR
jgi:hypothetical protein